MIIVADCQLQRFGASDWPKHCSSDMLIGTSKSGEDPPSDHLMLRDHCCLPHLLSLPTTADAPLLARFLSPADTETQQQPMPINTLTTCCLPWRKPSCIAGVFTFLFLFSVSPLLSRSIGWHLSLEPNIDSFTVADNKLVLLNFEDGRPVR